MNFKNLNEAFENKFSVSRSLLREEQEQEESRQLSKKRFLESIDRTLTEKHWKFTIPGTFRNAIFDAGDEEDYEGVRQALVSICEYVVDNIKESEFDVDEQEEIAEEFADFIEELGYMDFEDEDEANYYLNDLYDLLDNTDIFLGLRESLKEAVEDEDPEETYRLAIIDWLYDHDQARKDIEARIGVGIEYLSLLGLKAIISEYDQLARDFEAYFNDSLDESLNESQNQYDEKIFDIWWACVDAGTHQDYVINDIIENFIEETGKTYFSDDLDLTISNLTNSEKRALLRKMQEAAKDLLGNPYGDYDDYDECLNESDGQIDSTIKEKVIEKFNQEIDKSDIDHSIDEDGYGFHITRKDGSKLSYDASTGKMEFTPVKKLGEGKITGGSMPPKDVATIEPLINDFDKIEEANKDILYITWSFGRRVSDNKMTAGVDISTYRRKSEESLDMYLEALEDAIKKNGFKFDDSLGYDSEHWRKHAFGNGYHTQIIEDVEEVVEESFGYKPSFDEWYFQETGVNTSDLTDEQYDELWADENLMNHYRKFCDSLDESLNESKEDDVLTLYHGTNKELSNIDFLSSKELGLHAGTLEQAQNKGKIIYQIDVDKNTPTLNLHDDLTSGYFSSPEFLILLKNNNIIGDMDFENLYQTLRLYSGEDGENKYKGYSEAYRNFLLNKGFKLIKYPNKAEGSGYSYIILDDSIIKSIKNIDEKPESSESLNEEYAYRSMDALHELDREIEDYLNQNNFHGFIDLYDISPNDEPVPSITYHINGDWKHEHLRFKYLVKEFLNSKNIVHMITEREYPSDSDSYEADYTIHLMKHEDDIDESIDTVPGGKYWEPGAEDANDDLDSTIDNYRGEEPPFESLNESLPKEIKKDIDRIVKTHGAHNIPRWQIQSIAQDNPNYSKEIWGYVSDLEYPDNEIKKPKKKKKLKEDRDIDFSSPTAIDLLHEKEAMDYQLIEPLINFFDELENNYKCDITWNFGRRLSDDKMTAGVDVYLSGDFDNEDSEDYWLKKDEEILDRIRDNLPEYGFKFDDSLGYDRNPWKEHMLGDGYHTQIIEIEDVDECLTEERKPKYWNSMFAQKVIDAYEKGDLTFDNIKEWDKNYNGGIAPNPPFNTGEILKYYLNHSKNLSEDTIKQNGKWVNKGKEGTHGTFKTKKEADAQRKAMFANGFNEDLTEDTTGDLKKKDIKTTLTPIEVDKGWVYKPMDDSTVYENLVPYVGNDEAVKILDDVDGFYTRAVSEDIEDVELSKLKSIQAFVTERGLTTPSVDKKEPLVISLNNNLYLFNGNHRVSKAILSGKKRMKLKVLHMEYCGNKNKVYDLRRYSKTK